MFMAITGVTSVNAQTQAEQWAAYSLTADSITGDIQIAPTRLQMAGATLSVRKAGDLRRYRTSDGRLVPARLMQVTGAQDVTLRNGNRFGCRRPIRWIVLWRFDSGRKLGMDTYDGNLPPQALVAADVKNAPDPSTSNQWAGLCGSYFYSQKTSVATITN